MPLSIPQLVFAIVAAVSYALWQELFGRKKARVKSEDCSYIRQRRVSSPKKVLQPYHSQPHPRTQPANSDRSAQPFTSDRHVPSSLNHRSESCLTSRTHSITRTKEHVPGICAHWRGIWEREVDEFLASILQTAASIRMVKELARSVQQTIRSALPEAEVVGVSSGDLAGKCSLGMGDPEVELIIFVNPDALPSQLKSRLFRSGAAFPAELDARKVQKSAIRACTDRLVSTGGFKFRRSAFRGQEPKVTLLAPASFSFGSSVGTICRQGARSTPAVDEPVGTPVELSVNTLIPLYSDALQAACGRFDRQGTELLVLVRRWARDRGISHEAKGHLSPYAWTSLAAFFLQVTPFGNSFVVPALEGIHIDKSNVIVQRASPIDASDLLPSAEVLSRCNKVEHKSTIALFLEFVHFYSKEFDWRSEAVSLRTGRRAVPDLALPLHIIISSAGVPTQVGPHIQDLFDHKNNLGTSI
eukprot:CAMPEP_0169185762 /NCGR_PEP_ID=MMETSP1016-20121227/1980_1 /TAXON_ID=342587 /ORGANISM="Karlodinium micrum, Strain CCMP2283" /LENGTH=470 /DNA_ID=CAMNT_0009261509 /DNA_START=35 /DNA_END=1447 /DNA_ORIENTATION=+